MSSTSAKPVRRIGAPSVPMPFSPDLERMLMPHAAAILAAVREMVQEG